MQHSSQPFYYQNAPFSDLQNNMLTANARAKLEQHFSDMNREQAREIEKDLLNIQSQISTLQQKNDNDLARYIFESKKLMDNYMELFEVGSGLFGGKFNNLSAEEAEEKIVQLFIDGLLPPLDSLVRKVCPRTKWEALKIACREDYRAELLFKIEVSKKLKEQVQAYNASILKYHEDEYHRAENIAIFTFIGSSTQPSDHSNIGNVSRRKGYKTLAEFNQKYCPVAKKNNNRIEKCRPGTYEPSNRTPVSLPNQKLIVNVKKPAKRKRDLHDEYQYENDYESEQSKNQQSSKDGTYYNFTNDSIGTATYSRESRLKIFRSYIARKLGEKSIKKCKRKPVYKIYGERSYKEKKNFSIKKQKHITPMLTSNQPSQFDGKKSTSECNLIPKLVKDDNRDININNEVLVIDREHKTRSSLAKEANKLLEYNCSSRRKAPRSTVDFTNTEDPCYEYPSHGNESIQIGLTVYCRPKDKSGALKESQLQILPSFQKIYRDAYNVERVTLKGEEKSLPKSSSPTLKIVRSPRIQELAGSCIQQKQKLLLKYTSKRETLKEDKAKMAGSHRALLQKDRPPREKPPWPPPLKNKSEKVYQINHAKKNLIYSRF